MKKIVFACILIALSCEKNIYIPCDEGNYGYLTITAEYKWTCLIDIQDTTVDVRYYWFGKKDTRTMSLPAGEYTVGYSDPHFNNERERELMLKDEFAPEPSAWIDMSIGVTKCDTTKLQF